MMTWNDTRLTYPTCNSFNRYVVVFRLFDDHLVVGFADWRPTNNYTSGEWLTCYFTNNNPAGKKDVLYWLSYPTLPKIENATENKELIHVVKKKLK